MTGYSLNQGAMLIWNSRDRMSGGHWAAAASASQTPPESLSDEGFPFAKAFLYFHTRRPYQSSTESGSNGPPSIILYRKSSLVIDTGAKDVLSISPFKTGSCSIRAGHSEMWT